MLKNLRIAVIFIPAVIFAALIIVGAVDAKSFVATLTVAFEALMKNCGWMVSVTMLLFVFFMLFLFVHPIGNIKLGGPNAKPNLGMWQWFSISLCAGIGTGIVFWGAVEPLLFTMEPAPGMDLEPMSNAAMIWAMRTTFLHWTFTPYAIYVTFGVILAYAYHNMKQSFNVSSGFVPLLGCKAQKSSFAEFIDTLTVFALVGGIAGSLGYGLLQIGRGLNLIFGHEPSMFTYTAIAVLIVVAILLTSISGLRKGISWLSDNNAKIFIALMIFAMLCGPTGYICNLIVQSTGSYLTHFVEAMTFTAPFPDSKLWPQWWDMYWWVDWLSYGPLMGLFYARLGYGRTIRQFVLVNWLLPSLFGIMWFGIFGGLVLHAQFFENIDFFNIYRTSGMEAMTIASLELLPFSAVIKPFMLLIIAVSFITLANSMISTVATMSFRNNEGMEEAPASMKLFWGILIGGASLVFTLTGGIDGIKFVKTFAGFPIFLVGFIMLIGFLRYMSNRPRDAVGNYIYEDAIKEAKQIESNEKQPTP